jgi:hypothetical protein
MDLGLGKIDKIKRFRDLIDNKTILYSLNLSSLTKQSKHNAHMTLDRGLAVIFLV